MLTEFSYSIGDLYSYEGKRPTAIWNESGETEGSLQKGTLFVLIEFRNTHEGYVADPLITCRALLLNGSFVRFACQASELRVKKNEDNP